MRPVRLLTRAAAAGAVASALALTPLVPALAETSPDPRLVLQYALDQTSGSVAVDTSGNGRNGAVVNGGTWTGSEGLKLDGVNDYVRLPDNIMQGLSAITVSTEVLIAPAQATPYFIYGLGNTTSNAGNGYLFTTGDSYRTSIASGNWSTEQTLSQNQALARGVWKTITYTLSNGTATLFLDGVQVGQKTGVTITPGSIGSGLTTANYLGRSVYTADRYLSGSVRDFRIYNTALTPSEVAASVAPSDQLRKDRDVAALSLGDLSAVTANLSLPASGVNGSTVAWASSDPSVVTAAGVVTRPSAAQGAATVTLTATVTRGEASGTKVFSATVLPAESDQEKLAAATAALVLPAVDDVRGNITLPPTSGQAAVTWQSSNPIIDATGIVNRPAADTDVVLTATLTVGAASGTKQFTARVKAKPAVAPYAGYAFAYFTGNSIAGENIYMAASRGNDALHWDETNGGKPILTSTMGTKGLRDPFVIRAPEGDKFYMIATDLSIGSGTSWDSSQRQGSQYLEVWESYDLKNWSEQRHVKVSPATAGNTWAPEAYYDQGIGAYVVFWASKIYAENDPGHTAGVVNKMMYSTTRDFRTFSEAKVWNDPGTSVIDSTVIKDKDTYYRFTKDEGGVSGCVDIMQEKSNNLLAVDLPGSNPRNWALQSSCIGKNAGTAAVEGPTVFKSNTEEKFYLFLDEFGGRGYIPLESPSLETPAWKLSANYDLPASPRHGTVLPVTQTELDALRQTPKPVQANANGEILRYAFDQGSGTDVADSSGNGLNGKIVGGGSWQPDGALKLDGTTGYVDIPDNILSGVQDITVEADVLVSAAQSGAYFIYGFGNTDAAGVGNGYMFATGNSVYKTGIASGNWTTEQLANSTSALPRDSWKHLVYTLKGTVATVYLDGKKVGENLNATLNPGDIGFGSTTSNYLGKSVYNADRTLNGSLREFAIYNRALSAEEVQKISGDQAGLGDVSLADPSLLKVAPIVDSTSRKVTYPVKPGTDVGKLAPTFSLFPGAVSSPASGAAVDLGSPVTYKVTGPDGSTAEWTFAALEMKSPVLPGYTADPNIVVYGDTYYIYPTTDGIASWGSTKFSVYSSKNLVDWTDEGVVLDLANVSWTHSNAWAPTATSKNGKYYLYFSAGQSIGVAVADSPKGPFVDSGAPLVDKAAYGGAQQIDPAVFTDNDGVSYLFWGNGTARYVPLNADMVSYTAANVKTISGLSQFREGPFVHQRNGTFYMTYSIDDTRSENYRVGYATASSIAGPWTYKGVILEKKPELGILGTGHNSVVQVPGTDDWYIVYHRFAIPGGDGMHRETTIDRLTYAADGSIKPVVPTLESVGPQFADTSAPVVALATSPAAPNGADGWYLDPVTMSANATDNSGAAPTVEVAVDGGAWVPYLSSFEVASDGAHTIRARATDAAGNTSAEASVAVKIDRTAPQAGASLDEDRTLTLTATDPYSGVASLDYRVGTAEWLPYTAPVPAGRTAATVEFRAVDKGGNAATGTVDVPAPAGQSISFGEITPKTLGDSDFTISATATSNLPVTFAASGACTLLDASVHLTGAGTCSITARQEGSARFLPAPEVVRSFEVKAPVLDSFDRANGGVGSAWGGENGRQAYVIKDKALNPLLGGTLLHSATFGSDQTASLTLKTIAAKSVQGVVLKGQSGKSFLTAGVSALYDASARTVRVSTLGVDKNAWYSYGDIQASFAAGDVLTAKYVDGTVTVYRNADVVASVPLRTADVQFFAGKAGKTGISSTLATGSILDDFRAAAIAR
ncbi:family 43 glycosylhydrolase [Arthrobacter sp. CDRTa11]|uniref:family 43 glycosylhydrolase n=1 Tax=Arthrobacter sp. CDRTa11 TaxID=2651199 RepID=UPI0022657E0E|nr:family 43 glycosylhydrolase [Arthrobacter sp. CDRTa11]UZX03330.1 family 43 glycosylhydrolase [Arthrobacter sp. CDRTa11]